MKTFKKIVIGTIILSTLLVGVTACGTKTAATKDGKKTIKIAYLPITHAVPLYVEDQDAKLNNELLKNTNIELVKFGSWPELMDALNTGKVDGASVLIELGMKAKEQGIDLKVVALGHRDGNNVTVSKDIKSPSDLKGKTVAVPQRFSTQNILLYQMLKDAGVNYTDVKASAQELVNGYVKAGKEAEAKDSKIQNIALKYMSVDKAVLDLALKSTTYTNLKINEKDYNQFNKLSYNDGIIKKSS